MMEGGVWRHGEEYVHNTARDSLSPRGFYSLKEECGRDEVVVAEDEVNKPEVSSTQSGRHVNSQSTFSQSREQQVNMTTIPSSTMPKHTCSPRFTLARARRPFKLDLDDSRGATSVSPAELRQVIKKNAAIEATALSLRVQVIHHTSLPSPFPYKGRKKYSQPGKLIGTTLLVRQPNALPVHSQRIQPMGNQHSHRTSHGPHMLATSSSSVEDESSMESIMNPCARSKPQPRKSSINVLKKKIVPKPGATTNFTTTVIEVPRAATAPNLDLIEDNEDDWVDEKQNRQFRHAKTLSAPSPALLSQPGSPATITEESAARPLSAGTTITGVSIRSDEQEASSPFRLRVSALSPTIPTPSPLPEDSPHQYGLKDFTDTPSPPPDPNKAKRRSNGLDIFNEAKNLQSAASFLNGLSNARRRAESRARSTRSTTKSRLASASTTNLPYSNASANFLSPAYRSLSHLPLQEPPSPSSIESRPLTPKLDDLARTLGHTHKSSGFAYAKPLSFIQLKCYRNHDRLLRSGNKLYQVECAVCHKDEPSDFYWSCSWCAIRMCEVCRADFRKNGPKALKERVRNAEYGAQL